MPSRSVWSVLLLGAALTQAAAGTVIHEAGEPGLEPPQLLEDSRVQPVYPEDALRDGVQGTVLLRVVVTADGIVDDVEIFRSPFRGESLAQAAVDAVRRWRYQPARFQGRNVACRIMQTVPFYPPSTGPQKKPGRRGRKKKPSSKAVEPAPVHAAESTAVEDAPAPASTPAPTSAVTTEEKPATKIPPPPSPKRAAAEPPSEPVPPDLPAPVSLAIDIHSGGPGGLFLGQPGAQARLLGAAEKRDGGNVLRLAEQGMEVTLAASLGGEQIVALRYVFTQGDGFSASGLRTRKGLGHGSFCMGIVPAYGRPEERRESTDGNGNAVLILEYRRDGTRSRFLCTDGRLAELTLAWERE